MDNIFSAQFCSSNQPFHEMLVASLTSPGVIYRVTVALPDDPREEWTCTCPSWKWRGKCKHTAIVTPCHWDELDGPEEQTKDQKAHHECPRCQGETFDDLVLK